MFVSSANLSNMLQQRSTVESRELNSEIVMHFVVIILEIFPNTGVFIYS